MFITAVTVVTLAGALTESVDAVNSDWVLLKLEGGEVSGMARSAIVQNYKPNPTLV